MEFYPNIQVGKHSAAMLYKCNGGGESFSLRWSIRQQGSIVKKSLGIGWGMPFCRPQSALDFRIYVSEQPHRSNLHTKALTQRSKWWNLRGQAYRSNEFFHEIFTPWVWFMQVRNCRYTEFGNTLKKTFPQDSPQNSYWGEFLKL